MTRRPHCSRSPPRADSTCVMEAVDHKRIDLRSVRLDVFASSAPFVVPEVEAACRQAPPDIRFVTTAGRWRHRVSRRLRIRRARRLSEHAAGRHLLSRHRGHLPGVPLTPKPRHQTSLAATRSDSLARRASVAFRCRIRLPRKRSLAWLALTSYPDPTATSHLLGVAASAAKTTTSWAAGLTLVATLTVIVARAIRSRLPAATIEATVASDLADGREAVGSAS